MPKPDNSLNDLLDFTECLKELKINYYLTNGTLLGCIREQDFIEWDEDIDLDTLQEDLIPKIRNLADKLKEKGFHGYFVYTRNYPKIVCQRGKRKICLGGFRESKYFLERAKYRFPKKFFNFAKSSVRYGTLQGQKFSIPIFSEDLLSFIYGDWLKPIKEKDEDKYSTGEHYIKPWLYQKIRTINFRIQSQFYKQYF